MRSLVLIAIVACFALACDGEPNLCGSLTACTDDGRSCPGENDEYFCWRFALDDDEYYYCCATYEQACQHACDVSECAVFLSMPPQPACDQ